MTKQELEDLADILDGVWSIDEKSQSFCIDGTLYVSNILKAAEYIKSKQI